MQNPKCKNEKLITICIINEDEVVKFAATELAKYMRRVTGCRVSIKQRRKYCDTISAIWLVTFDDFAGMLPAAEDTLDAFDDVISIDMNGQSGIIAGYSSRSVLLAVYRYLYALGCRFVYPGKQGEYLPYVEIENTRVKMFEKPACKYRGVCIEGAVSIENVEEMIDWLPKLGFNSYFIQFREAYVFFKRWYRHVRNPLAESKEEFPVQQAREYVKRLGGEIKKRGLIYQAVGHGWTCEPFGVPGLAWDKWEGEVSESTLKYFALVNGERKLWGDVPLNTNACYSNKDARKIIIDDICNYATGHEDVDIIHFWLSDGSNNQCECETCLKKTPSDEYVSLLNELDEEMSRQNIQTRIVFLIYQDLLWSPVCEKLKSNSRFILLFAPITRSYRSSFAVKEALPELPAYKRNKLTFPASVEENVGFLKEWQKDFKGDGFDFDYHYMWVHHRDPGGFQISRVLYEDIRNLKNLGLCGLTSCQVQRAMFPNSLGMTVMGNALWDEDTSYEDIALDYFKNTYGEGWDAAKAYLEQLSKLYFMLNLENKNYSASQEKAGVCEVANELIAAFKPQAVLYLNGKKGCQRLAWRYLCMHTDIWFKITSALKLIYEGDRVSARAAWTGISLMLWENENKYQKVFDIFNFTRTFDDIFLK